MDFFVQNKCSRQFRTVQSKNKTNILQTFHFTIFSLAVNLDCSFPFTVKLDCDQGLSNSKNVKMNQKSRPYERGSSEARFCKSFARVKSQNVRCHSLIIFPHAVLKPHSCLCIFKHGISNPGLSLWNHVFFSHVSHVCMEKSSVNILLNFSFCVWWPVLGSN